MQKYIYILVFMVTCASIQADQNIRVNTPYRASLVASLLNKVGDQEVINSLEFWKNLDEKEFKSLPYEIRQAARAMLEENEEDFWKHFDKQLQKSQNTTQSDYDLTHFIR